jgi:hypothetical protein
MSAVEEYRKVAAHIKADSVYDEHRGMGMMCSPVAHQCQEMADAAILELEAENGRLRDDLTICRGVDVAQLAVIMHKRAEQAEAEVTATHDYAQGELERANKAEAELAALKERRCETCTHWHTDYDFTCPIYALDGYWYGANFWCIRWAARGEEK